LINSQALEHLKADIEYLKFEAESLHQVIEFIPYSDKPLDGSSILEIFLTIDSIQVKVYRIFKDISSKGSSLDIADYEIFKNVELSTEEIEKYSIDTITSDLFKNRTNIVDYLGSKDFNFFEVELEEQGEIITIYQLLSAMIKQERALLKNIADLVMTYQTDRQFQRQISKRPT
jgi:hypothetical protein